MLRINFTRDVALHTYTVAICGVMLGMSLESWLRDTGRRWLRAVGELIRQGRKRKSPLTAGEREGEK